MASLCWTAPTPDANYDANQAERTRFFDMIAPKGNWKGAVDCWIDVDVLPDCYQACIFFTGSKLKIIAVDNDTMRVRVTAPGYYWAVGA